MQEENGVYDYGHRQYDQVIGQFTSIDALAEKSHRLSTYTYVDKEYWSWWWHDSCFTCAWGAHGADHMAVLIQDKDDNYRLYSKNGTTEHGGLYGPNDKTNDAWHIGNDVGNDSFKSPQEFMDSKLNPVENKKTGEREYIEGYVIPTTKTEDKKAVDTANKDYNVLVSNCDCTVQKALDAAGKEDGSPSTAETIITTVMAPAVSIAEDKIPNLFYQLIKKQNNSTVITPQWYENKTYCYRLWNDINNILWF